VPHPAGEIGRAMGRAVRYEPISLEAFHASMMAVGGPLVADVFTDICREVLDGRNAKLGDGVQRALGRAPRDFADFCHAVASDGAWDEAA